MIKRLYRCDPMPWSILFLIMMVILYTGSLLFGAIKECTQAPDSILRALTTGTLKYILLGVLLLSIPIWFRQSINKTGILDFSERVSLYPIGLLLITVVPSCNSLYFIIAAGLILQLFSQIIGIKEGEASSSASFVGGIIIAFASFISPYFLLLALFLWIALASLNALNWRAIVWSILGVFGPFYLYFTIEYILTGTVSTFSFEGLLQAESGIMSQGLRISWVIYLVIFIALFALLLLRSVSASRKGIVVRRKIIRLGIILFLITSTISVLIFQFEGASAFLSLLSVPIAIIFLEMYRTGKPLLYDILFLSWLVLTALTSWL